MNATERPGIDPDSLLVTVDEACVLLRMSRTAIFELLKLGVLTRVKLLGRTRIERAEIEAVIARSGRDAGSSP